MLVLFKFLYLVSQITSDSIKSWTTVKANAQVLRVFLFGFGFFFLYGFVWLFFLINKYECAVYDRIKRTRRVPLLHP